MSDDTNESENGFPEPSHVSQEDYAPPMHLDEPAGSSIRRAQIVTAAVVAAGIAVGAIIGIAHAHSGPGPVASVAATPDPNAPQPAGNINASVDATPFPVTTRSPYQLSPLGGQDPNAQQAILAQQQLQRERDSARMIAMLRAQNQAQQQTVPAVAQASEAQPQSTASLSPAHGAMTIEQPQSQNANVIAGNQSEKAVTDSPEIGDNSASGRPIATQGGVVQNLQTQNTSAQHRFIENNEQSTGIGYVRPQSAYQLNPTTVIPARLLSAINSDLPGPVKAQVVQPIYDSRTHSTVVIPQGAMLYGVYDSAIVSGQNRLLVAWNEIIFPNGEDFRMGGMPGTDAQGASGFSGDVNKHTGEIYKSAFLLTMLGVAEGALVPQPQSILQAPTISQIAAQNAGAQLANVGNKVVDQQVQRAPTITIAPPYLFQVFVTKTLPLDAYQE